MTTPTKEQRVLSQLKDPDRLDADTAIELERCVTGNLWDALRIALACLEVSK